MLQLSLWTVEELPPPSTSCNLRSPSACRNSFLAQQRWRLCVQRKAPKSFRNAHQSGRDSSTTQSEMSKRTIRGSLCLVTTEVNDNGRAIGESHQNARYTDQEVEMVRNLREEGYRLADIAAMMDMPIRTVRGYLDGTRRSQSVAGWKKQKRWVKTN